MIAKRKAAKKRRRGRHWMDRGAHVVHEARQCQLRRAAPAANRVLRLVDDDVKPRAGEFDRGGKTIWPGPDDNRIYIGHVFVTFLTLRWGALRLP